MILDLNRTNCFIIKQINIKINNTLRSFILFHQKSKKTVIKECNSKSRSHDSKKIKNHNHNDYLNKEMRKNRKGKRERGRMESDVTVVRREEVDVTITE